MSCASASFLSFRCPHFFGSSWSSICTAARARILERADHVHHVQRLAIAGVAVHQHRQRAGPRDLADEEADLVDRDHAEVRQPHAGRHRGAREVQRLEPGRLRLQRGHPVMRARDLHDPAPLRAACGTGRPRVRWAIGGDQVGHPGFLYVQLAYRPRFIRWGGRLHHARPPSKRARTEWSAVNGHDRRAADPRPAAEGVDCAERHRDAQALHPRLRKPGADRARTR